jgi:hypothetical protein
MAKKKVPFELKTKEPLPIIKKEEVKKPEVKKTSASLVVKKPVVKAKAKVELVPEVKLTSERKLKTSALVREHRRRITAWAV